jgi:eukaryotic-like serine/threonine-protein kinase
MSDMTDRTESIFTAAADLASPEERAAYLEQACAGNAALRAQLEALLRAHARTGHLLDQPLPGVAKLATAFECGARSGAVIAGRYKLLEAIGEGGMGAVWVAEQLEPVRRKVALKLIKPGMDTKTVLARFEAERQALAVLDHPNIAKVLDGGVTEAGRPFFVMEYFKGVPITEYCEATRLSLSDRLQLFVQVCAAVQHAHHKGIIHRDLKPSNILVAPYDDLPVPKVIDFGLAKAINQSLTENTLFTAHETVLGTPLYMSPEQAQLNNLDVDTRSDIYSLGVLLYELLTGTTPLERQRVKAAAWEEVKRLIREEEPPRPSTRLSSTEMLPSLAACRQTEPARLTREIRGELDWIVMKSLEKDRNRRYQSANGLAMDLQRHLTGEAILAAPPGIRYRLAKLARRHRAALTTVAAIALLLLGGTAVSLWQAVRATRAENAAELAKADAIRREESERLAHLDAQMQKELAEKAAAAEKLANQQAQKRLRQLEKITVVLGSIFRKLDPRDVADEKRPLQLLLLENLDQAAAQLEGESIGDPLSVAAVQDTFGRSLVALGAPEKAIVLQEKALATRRAVLGRDDNLTLENMYDLSIAYREAGKPDLAVPLFEEILKLRKAHGPEDRETLRAMNNLAQAYSDTNRLNLSIPLFEESFRLHKAKFGPDDRGTLLVMQDLALAYDEAGKLDPAVRLFEEALALARARLGADHPTTLIIMSNLGATYKDAGKFDLALPLLQETVRLNKARFGSEHPDTTASLDNLGLTYQAAGKLDLAIPLLQQSLEVRKSQLGPEHPRTVKSMNNLALAYWAVGQKKLAVPLLEEAVKIQKARHHPDNSDTLQVVVNLANTYIGTQEMDKAIPLLEDVMRRQESRQVPPGYPRAGGGPRQAGKPIWEDPITLNAADHLALCYLRTGRPRDALPLLEEAYRGSKDPRYAEIGQLLLEAYEKSGEGAKLARLVREMLAETRATLPAGSPQLATELAHYGGSFLNLKMGAEAEPLLRECLAIRQKVEPDGWSSFNAQSMLGEALLDQKKYTAAEPLLLAGHEGLKNRQAQIPPGSKTRLTKAAMRLIQLYEATGRKEDAAKLREAGDSHFREDNTEKKSSK